MPDASNQSTGSRSRLQKPSNLPNLTALLQQRERFARYSFNFIFLAPGEPTETLRRLFDRLPQI